MKRAVIAALLCVLGLAAVVGWAAASAATPLRIELTAPTMCEADFDDGEVTPTLDVAWEITGGTPPYRVAVGNTLSDEAEGVADLLCGVWWSDEVDSGVMTIQARVTDAQGRAATAIKPVYAVRAVTAERFLNRRDQRLTRGRTYRVYGVLMTMPDELELYLSDRRRHLSSPTGSDNVATVLHTGSRTDQAIRGGTVIWFSRADGREARRQVSEHLPHSTATLHNAALDDLAASVGRLPELTALPPGIANTDNPKLTLKLVAPAICDQPTDPEPWGGAAARDVPVAWLISGASGPYRVVINGREFEATNGSVDVQCGELTGRYADSGLQIVHGTVIDADGNVASDVVYVYSIADAHVARHLTNGETYRLYPDHSIGLLVTIPLSAAVQLEGFGGEVCFGSEHCEDSLQFSLREGEAGAFVSIGIETGTEGWRRTGDLDCAKVYESGCTEGLPPSHPIHAQIDALLASIGRPPELPPEHRDQLAPLTIMGYADPPSCVAGSPVVHNTMDLYDGRPLGTMAGGTVNLRLSISGGFWTPITVTADGTNLYGDGWHWMGGIHGPRSYGRMEAEDRLFPVECGDDEVGDRTIHLSARDNSDPPQEASGDVSFAVLSAFGGEERLDLWAVPQPSGFCKPGGRAMIAWGIQEDATAPYLVAVQGVDGLLPRKGAAWVTCQLEAGQQTVWVLAADSGDPRRSAAVPVLLTVTDDPPVPNTFLAAASAAVSACVPGSEVEVLWSAIGGLPPYTARDLESPSRSSLSANSFTAICPQPLEGSSNATYLAFEARDGSVLRWHRILLVGWEIPASGARPEGSEGRANGVHAE